MGRLLTHDEYIKAAKFHPDIEIIGQYTGMHNKIQFKCKRCNRTGFKVACDLKNGIGCPYCAHTQTSFAENFIFLALALVIDSTIEAEDIVSVKKRDRTAINNELDIYLPDYKLAIEPGSWSFHKKTLAKDINKHDICIQNGIDIMIIYDCFNDDDAEMVSEYDYITTYNKWLAVEKDYSSLKKIIGTILEKIDVDFDFTDDDWNNIAIVASDMSRRISIDEYKKRLKEVNPDVELIGELKGNMTAKVKFRCLKDGCGYEWEASPSQLIKQNPTGCRKCAKTLKPTDDQFVAIIKEKLPDITIVGKYINSATKIAYICNICGYHGEATPNQLLSGHGCRECSLKAKHAKMRKSQEQFNNEIHEIHPELEIVGEYTGDSDIIECRCTICGNTIFPHAGDLKRHGCIYCAQNKNAQRKQKPVRCIETGESYPSVKAARMATGIKNIDGVCRGKNHMAGGYTWEYIKEKNI